MYPPDTNDFAINGVNSIAPPIDIELICCNNIDQCVSNTFTVTPTNSNPTLIATHNTNYILQYDTNTDTGQYF
jgi:hypothetical protein